MAAEVGGPLDAPPTPAGTHSSSAGWRGAQAEEQEEEEEREKQQEAGRGMGGGRGSVCPERVQGWEGWVERGHSKPLMGIRKPPSLPMCGGGRRL